MVDPLTFQPFFDVFGQARAPHAPAVNTAATARLERVLSTPVDGPGRGILLRAPRAGYGKTHLISYVQHRLGTTHEFLPLTPLDGSRIDAAGAIEAALRRLTRPLPAGGGLTSLDLQARRLFSLALQPLVSTGEVPCQDREAALGALRQRPVETFDFHHSQAVTAHWTKENFEVLGPRLALELSRGTGTSLNESSFWLAALFRFAVATPEHPGRTGMIIQSAISDAGVERYAALLALLAQIGRVVVVADDLEGLHAEPQAALRFASFLASIRQEAPRVDVLISLNDDVWDSAFSPALSGGLQDRVSEVEIRLSPLDEASLHGLIETRAPGRGHDVNRGLALPAGELYARRVLRKLAELDETAPAPPPEPQPAAPAAPAPAFPAQEIDSAPAPAAPSEVTTLEPESPPEPETLTRLEPEIQPEPDPEPVPSPALEPAPPAPEPVAVFEPVVPETSPFTAESEAATTDGPPAPPEATTASGGDRIDDLLKQFRERYGRE